MTSPSAPDEPPTAAEHDAAPAAASPQRRRWLPRRRAPGGAPGDATPEAITPPPPAQEPAIPADGPAAAAAGELVDAGADDPLAAPARAGGPRRLRRRRRKLLTRREEAVYHLGGLAFELYRRDMLPEGVMRRRAGEVAELDDTVRDIDVRLGELERERRGRRRAEEPDPAVGCCRVCRATFRAEARFCWSCGTQLVPTSHEGDEQATAVIAVPPAG